MEDLNQEEREFQDNNVETDEDSNSQQGDETTMSLDDFNAMRGTQFKNWDDVVKSGKEADKAFAKGEHKKVQETKNDNQATERPDVIKSLYFNAKPEAKEVWNEVVELANKTGEDPYAVYESTPAFQERAARLHKEAQKESEAKSKLDAPSSFKSSGKVNLDKVKPEDVKNLSIQDKCTTRFYFKS